MKALIHFAVFLSGLVLWLAVPDAFPHAGAVGLVLAVACGALYALGFATVMLIAYATRNAVKARSPRKRLPRDFFDRI